MDLDDSTTRHALKIAIALTAIAITLLLYLATTRNWKRNARIALDIALIAATIASIAAYFEFGWLRYGQYMNPHDCFHYYIGAKYSTEHHYANLYRCALIADAQLGPKYTSNRIRNLDNHTFEPTAAVASRKNTLLQPFTPERWAQFKEDIAYFRTQMPPSKWNLVLQDKGYNATPVWNAAARILTNAIPTTSPWGMRLLTYLDLILLIAAFTLIGATFGWRAAALAILFHGTNYFMSFVHIKGAILRLDWVVATVAAFCLLHRKHYKTAGFFMAIATCSRVFPLLFAFPLGCKMLWNWYEAWRTRKLETKVPINRDYIAFSSRYQVILGNASVLKAKLCSVFTRYQATTTNYIAFFATFAITSALFVLFSIALDGNLDLWKAFFAKIAVHNADISTTRVGFKYIFLESATDKAAEFQQYALLWRCILLAVLALTAFLARKIKDHETIALGFIPIFFLTAPTFYYYVMLLVPFLYFATRRNEFAFTLGTILFYAVTIAAFTANYYLPQHFTLMILLSWLLMGLCFYLAVTTFLPPKPSLATNAPYIPQNPPYNPKNKPRKTKNKPYNAKTKAYNASTRPYNATDEAYNASTRPYNATDEAYNASTRPYNASTRPYNASTRPYFASTRPYFASTRAYFASTWAYFASTRPYFAKDEASSDALQAPKTTKQAPFRSFIIGVTAAIALCCIVLGSIRAFQAAKTPILTPATPSDTATLVFVGDIMMSRGVTRDLEANGRDYTFPFEKTATYTKTADLAFCNLEGPISGRGEAINKKYTFNAPPESIEGLQYAGFDAVSVANNHILDYGTPSLDDTTATLEANAIDALGLSTENAPQTPFTATYNGIKVGMLAYCDPDSPYGSAKEYSTFKTRPASATRDTVKRDIETLRPQCDIVAVSIHWGIEYKDEPDQHQRELGRYIIDCGANLVIGHHPHVLQPFEAYKGGLIAYSLGNFVFDQRSKPATRQSRLLQVKVTRAGVVEADYLPLEIPLNVWQPTPTQAAFIPIPLH